VRTYTLVPGKANAWKLTLFEDGQEVGGGVGQEDDYQELLDEALLFCGGDVNGH